MGRKVKWKAEQLMEVSETEPPEMAITTEVTEPGEQLLVELPTSETPTLHGGDKEDFLQEFRSSPSYPPGYSIIKESPIVIQQVVDNEETTETSIGVGDEDTGDHLHIPKESQTSNGPSVMGGKEKSGNTLEQCVANIRIF